MLQYNERWSKVTNHEISYTTEELAKLLKVSKLTVYDLIKKGEIQAYRVGRQMRVDASELENYKLRQKEVQVIPSIPEVQKTLNKEENSHSIVVCGQDHSLDLLTRELEKENLNYSPFRSHLGSLDGLVSMYQGKADIVSTHLYDGETNTYNLPYIRRILVSKSFVVIRLMKRQVGLYVAKGNPKKINSWGDFKRNDISIINRESGAGVRALLDEQLRLYGVDKDIVNGYENEQTSHLGVASTVASGKADIGVGIINTAKVTDVDFIPMVEEDYDLVIVKNEKTAPVIQSLLNILKKSSFQEKMISLGYNIDSIGKVIYEQ